VRNAAEKSQCPLFAKVIAAQPRRISRLRLNIAPANGDKQGA